MTRNLTSQIAFDLILRHGVTLDQAAFSWQGKTHHSAQVLYDALSKIVWRRVRTLQPEDLGRITAQAPSEVRIDCVGQPVEGFVQRHGTKLYDVHNGTWLNKYSDGLSLLRRIVTTAIIAKMFDILEMRGC